MSSPMVENALWEFLLANWAKTPIVDIDNTRSNTLHDLYEGLHTGVPEDYCEWITLQFFYAPDTPASVGSPGSNYWREEGEFLLYVFAPTGTQKTKIKEYGTDLLNLFRAAAADSTLTDGVQITSVSGPAPREQQPIQEGNWYALALAISYYCMHQEVPYNGLPN